MLDDLKAGKNYRSVRYMETVADYYDIPSVNFADDVLELLNEDKLVFKGDSKKEYSGKIVFTNDGTHPTYDGGHPIYTKTLSRSLLQMNKAQEKAHALKAPLYPGNYEKAKMIPFDEVEDYIGHAPGGVCPFGIRDGVKVYLDESLKRYDTVYPAAGNDHSAVKLTIVELEEVAGASGWIDVCK